MGLEKTGNHKQNGESPHPATQLLPLPISEEPTPKFENFNQPLQTKNVNVISRKSNGERTIFERGKSNEIIRKSEREKEADREDGPWRVAVIELGRGVMNGVCPGPWGEERYRHLTETVAFFPSLTVWFKLISFSNLLPKNNFQK